MKVYVTGASGFIGRHIVARLLDQGHSVVAFVRDRKLHGRGIGWIDAHLLASALVGRLKLWTTDPALAVLARELGIA